MSVRCQGFQLERRHGQGFHAGQGQMLFSLKCEKNVGQLDSSHAFANDNLGIEKDHPINVMTMQLQVLKIFQNTSVETYIVASNKVTKSI